MVTEENGVLPNTVSLFLVEHCKIYFAALFYTAYVLDIKLFSAQEFLTILKVTFRSEFLVNNLTLCCGTKKF